MGGETYEASATELGVLEALEAQPETEPAKATPTILGRLQVNQCIEIDQSGRIKQLPGGYKAVESAGG